MPKQFADLSAAPFFQSKKVVRARRIEEVVTRADGVYVRFEDFGPFEADTRLPAEVMARYTPGPGDFVVEYQDGYQSISPASAFEGGYAEFDPDDKPFGGVLNAEALIHEQLKIALASALADLHTRGSAYN